VFITFISSREKLILELLISEQEDVKIKDLSKKLDVSSRTIQRDLTNLEQTLNAFQLKLIRKSGVGVQIIGEEMSKQHLLKQLRSVTHRDYTLEERLVLIICILYEMSEPVKLFALASELRVSTATVSADIEKLEQQLKPVQLTILKKRGYGVELGGSENAKRRAISYVLSKNVKEEDLLSLIKESEEDSLTMESDIVSKRLLQLVDKQKLVVIKQMIKEHFPHLVQSMTDHAYVGLIVHLTLAMDRIMRGESMEENEVNVDQMNDDPQFNTAIKIVEKLKECFDIAIPQSEVSYLLMHLQGSKLRKQNISVIASTNVELSRQVKLLIEKMEQLTDVSLATNHSLFEGLVTHLKPAIHRIEQNMGIINPLVNEVQANYPELFEQVEEAVKTVYPTLAFPKEEISFLVMHFGAVLIEVMRKEGLKAYVICASGIGTSKLLASRLLHDIPEISAVFNVSSFELNSLAKTITERDLIISTIELKELAQDYMLVTPFLTNNVMEQIRLYARRKMLVPKLYEAPSANKMLVDKVTSKMENLQHYTSVIVTILKNFTVDDIPKRNAASDYVAHISSILHQRQLIEAPAVGVDALLRGARSGVGIPNTSLALYHTRNDAIWSPSFTIHRLEESIEVNGMDGKPCYVNTLLMLLAPVKLEQAELEILSFISTLLIQDEERIKLFESGDQPQIHKCLATEFERFIKENVN